MAGRVTAENYEAMKGFCSWFWERRAAEWDQLGLAAEDRPLSVLETFEGKSMAIARESVRVGIGDIMEETQAVSGEQLAEVDTTLACLGLPTLTEIRLQFWGKIEAIMRRGHVRSETEFYALRNVVEAMPPSEQTRAWQLLGAFETQLPKQPTGTS